MKSITMEITQKQADAAAKPRFASYKDIKSYEDACEYLGITPMPADCSRRQAADEAAYAKLKVIARAVRGGEEFSFRKAIENRKYYYPWWYIVTKEYYENYLTNKEKKRGVCIGGYAFGGANAGYAYEEVEGDPSTIIAYTGTVFCFYDSERCEYLCTQFKELIAQYYFTGCE